MKKLLALCTFLLTLPTIGLCQDSARIVRGTDTAYLVPAAALTNANLTGDSLDHFRAANDSCAKENGLLRGENTELRGAVADLKDASAYYVQMDALHIEQRKKDRRKIDALKTVVKMALPVIIAETALIVWLKVR